MIVNYAAGLHWAYSAKAWCGIFASMSDGRVLLRHEITWIRTAPEDAAKDLVDKCEQWGLGMPRDAQAKGLAMLRYVVAQEAIFPKATRAVGETIAEKFYKAHVPLRKADMDEVNGWNAVRGWLKTRTHFDPAVIDPATNLPVPIVGPSLIVHPDCAYFLRTFPTLVSDEKNPDLMVETVEAFPALGLRHYVMSRPAPATTAPTQAPPTGANAVYADVQKIRNSTQRQRLGSDNVITR